MGFESFRIELRGKRTTRAVVDETVRKLSHVKLDTQSVLTPGSICYVLDDGQHVIEIEIMDAPARISCRFTLCHPPSVDTAFLGLVRELMACLGLEAKICDDVLPQHASLFPLARYEEFSVLTLGYIAARRTEWIAAFGNEQAAATTNEAYERFILPRCQPVHQLVGQAVRDSE